MVPFGWLVLSLVFVDELLAMAAFGVWGWHASESPARWLLVWVLPLTAMTVWWLWASPRAPYGGPVRRPVVKVLVLGFASAALWSAGHPGWAAALLVFSAVVNGLALVPTIRDLPEQVSPTR